MNNEEIFIEFYDSITSLGLLEETYSIFKSDIIRYEKKNDILHRIHKEFVEEITKLPRYIASLSSYETFFSFEKNDLIYVIENNWKKIRVMISHVIS